MEPSNQQHMFPLSGKLLAFNTYWEICCTNKMRVCVCKISHALLLMHLEQDKENTHPHAGRTVAEPPGTGIWIRGSSVPSCPHSVTCAVCGSWLLLLHTSG